MDNQTSVRNNNQSNKLYILNGFTYGPQGPDSLEEVRVPGVIITVSGPRNATLVTDLLGNFSSGLLPEGKYRLSFSEPSGMYYAAPRSIYLSSDAPYSIGLSVLGDKRRGERSSEGGGGGSNPKNVIRGFVTDRTLKPLSGMTVRVNSVILEKKGQGLIMGIASVFTKIFKRKGVQEAVLRKSREEEPIKLEVKTKKAGTFSTKRLPNGSYIVSCQDPSSKYRFSSKFIVLKGKPVGTVHFRGYSKEDIEELKKKFQVRKAGEPEEEKKEEDKTKQEQKQAQQRLEKELRKAQAQKDAVRARLERLSRASQEALRARTRLFAQTPKYFKSFGQGGARFAGQAGQATTRIGTKVAQTGMRGATMGARLVLAAGTRAAAVAAAFPGTWIVIIVAVVVIILIILFFFFFGGGGGGTGGSTSPSAPNATTASGLNYYIPFRDPSVLPDNIRDIIASNWPGARLENFDTIVSKSQANGWNPSFVLTLWIEESGGQAGISFFDGNPGGYKDALGCDPDPPTNDINVSLACLFDPVTGFGSLTKDMFADFMCRYSSNGMTAPCNFINKPNFVPNIKSIYSQLVPSGAGALVEVSPPPAKFVSGSCPLQGGTVSCGSEKNPRGNPLCGHCDTAYKASFPNLCTYPEIYYAEDVAGEQGQSVFLPQINGQKVNWTFIKQENSISGIGVLISYKGMVESSPDKYWLRFAHVDPGSGVLQGMSGDEGAKICTTDSRCNHVHIELATLDGSGKTPIDAALSFCL